jgi:hypothetical protein
VFHAKVEILYRLVRLFEINKEFRLPEDRFCIFVQLSRTQSKLRNEWSRLVQESLVTSANANQSDAELQSSSGSCYSNQRFWILSSKRFLTHSSPQYFPHGCSGVCTISLLLSLFTTFVDLALPFSCQPVHYSRT